MDEESSTSEAPKPQTRFVATRREFSNGTSMDVVKIGGASLFLMPNDGKRPAEILRTGSFGMKIVTQTTNPIMVTICVVVELCWPVTRDTPVVRVGHRRFAFAMPGLLYGLQLPENCRESGIHTLEKFLMKFSNYQDLPEKVNGTQFSVPEHEPWFWSTSQPLIEQVTVPLLTQIGAGPGTWPTALAGLNDGAQKAIRMSGITKLITKGILVGAVDSNRIDIFDTRSSSSLDEVNMRKAYPTIFVFSDIVEAVEATGFIFSGNHQALPPCYPTWTPLPGFLIWNINKNGLIFFLQTIMRCAEEYRNQRMAETRRMIAATGRMNLGSSSEGRNSTGAGDPMEVERCDKSMEEEHQPKNEDEEIEEAAGPAREFTFPILRTTSTASQGSSNI